MLNLIYLVLLWLSDPTHASLVVIGAVYAFGHVVALTGWGSGQRAATILQRLVDVVAANYGAAANAKVTVDKVDAAFTAATANPEIPHA